MEDRIEQLAQQLDRFERKNRRLGIAIVICFAMLGIVCFAGFAPLTKDESNRTTGKDLPPDPALESLPLVVESLPLEDDIEVSTITAERFVLLDGERRPRAELKMGDAGAVLSMKDEKGRDRLILTSSNDSSSMIQFDEAGKARVMLRSDANGAHFNLADDEGRDRMLLTVVESGPKLILNGEGANARTGIAYFGNSGLMRFDNANGQVSVVLGTDEKGAVFVLTDSDGKVLYSAQDGSASDR